MNHANWAALGLVGTMAVLGADGSGPKGLGPHPERRGVDTSLGQRAACFVRPCQIALSRLATLSSDRQPEQLPQGAIQVTQDRQGRFLVRSSAFDDILVFDSNGELTTTARTAGAPRFEAIGTFALGPDDRIWAHDYRAGRVVILDRALTVKRTIVSSFGPTIVTADENWIVNAQIQDAALIGFPIHLANPEGTVLRSFGIDVPQYRSDIRLLATRLVSPASDHTIWSVAPGRYVVERWDPDTGELRQRIPVDSEWFKESARLTPDERERPNPVIEPIWEQDGLLWLVIRDADLRWEVPERANEERPHDPDEYERTYDWVVEALDPSDGTVIASRRFTQGLWARPGRLLASLTPSGRPDPEREIDIWRVSLR